MEKAINNQAELVPKERNYWLDNTKFFLIFLVVIGHFLEELISNRTIKEVFIFIYTFHMPLFIFITGFFSKNVEKSRKRAINYLILYIIMQSIILLFTKQKFSMVKPCFALWYLQAIITYNLMLPIISKSKPIVLMILSIASGLIIGFDGNAGEIGSLSRIFVMSPFFIMGYFAREDQLRKLKNKKNIIFAVVFLMLLTITIPTATEKIGKLTKLLQGKTSYDTMKMGTMGAIYRAIWYIIATITSFSVLSIIPKRKIVCISKFGTRTLQVYCLHILVILGLRKLNVYKSVDTIKEFCYLISFAIVLVPILSLKIFSYPFDFMMGKRIKTINNKESKNEYKEKNKEVIE